jgi:hypothetical protein
MRSVFIILATIFSLSHISAAAQEPQNSDIVSNYNIETLEPLLTHYGFTHERYVTGDNQTYLKLSRNGKELMLMPLACINTICPGLLMVSPITDADATVEDVRKYNRLTYYSTAILEDSGSLYLQRYLIGDHGTTVGTLKVNLDVFEYSIDEWFTKTAQ